MSSDASDGLTEANHQMLRINYGVWSMSRRAIAAVAVRTDLASGERLVALSLASFAGRENVRGPERRPRRREPAEPKPLPPGAGASDHPGPPVRRRTRHRPIARNHPGDHLGKRPRPRPPSGMVHSPMSARRYRIVVKGELGPRYASAFDGMASRRSLSSPVRRFAFEFSERRRLPSAC
jgi:hypothetical protein